MITPLQSSSFDNMQLNAGMFLANFDYTEYATVAAVKTAIKTLMEEKSTDILGATRGGGTFTVTKESREIEADGKRNSFVGSTIIDSVDASITGTLLELHAENWQRGMAAADVTDSEDGKKHTIQMRNDLKDSDYLEHLCWVGDMNKGGLVLIAFDNALNTGDVNFTFTDKGEGTLPFEFHAYQKDVSNDEYAPFAVVLLDA